MIINRYDDFRWSRFVDNIAWIGIRDKLSFMVIISTLYGHYLNIFLFIILLWSRTKLDYFSHRVGITIILFLLTIYDNNILYLVYLTMYEFERFIIIIFPELLRTIIEKVKKDKYMMSEPIQTLINRCYKSIIVITYDFNKGIIELFSAFNKFININDGSEPIPVDTVKEIVSILANMEKLSIGYCNQGIVIILVEKILIIGHLSIRLGKNRIVSNLSECGKVESSTFLDSDPQLTDIPIVPSRIGGDYLRQLAVCGSIFSRNISQVVRPEVGMLCNICNISKNTFYLTDCNHTACRECMLTWLTQSNTCPYCRKIIDDPHNSH